jgi:hypothetical protein
MMKNATDRMFFLILPGSIERFDAFLFAFDRPPILVWHDRASKLICFFEDFRVSRAPPERRSDVEPL